MSKFIDSTSDTAGVAIVVPVVVSVVEGVDGTRAPYSVDMDIVGARLGVGQLWPFWATNGP